MKNLIIVFCLLSYCFFTSDILQAQSLDFNNKEIVWINNPTGGDAIQVEFYGKYESGKKSKEYYYFPTSSMFKIGAKSNGIPNFTFIQYTSDGSGTNKKVTCPDEQGALLHAGVSFGLNKWQLDELQTKLEEKVPAAEIVGIVPIRQANARRVYELDEKGENANDDADAINANIKSIAENPIKITATLINGDGEETNVKIKSNGTAPTRSGDEAIISANLDAANGVTFADAFTTGNSLISTNFYYEYDLIAPITNASVKYNWSKFEQSYEKNVQEYHEWSKRKHKLNFDLKLDPFSAIAAAFVPKTKIIGAIGRFFKKGKRGDSNISFKTEEKVGYTQKEIRSVYEFMREKELVTFKFEATGAEMGSLQEAEIKALRNKIFEHFWTVFTTKYTTTKPEVPENSNNTSLSSNNSSNKKDATKDANKNVYHFKHTEINNSVKNQQIEKEEKIDLKLPVTFIKTLTYTLAINSAGTSRKDTPGTRNYPTVIDDKTRCEKCIRVVNLCDVEYQRREVSFVLDQYLIEMMQSDNRYVNSISMQVRNGDAYYDEFVITPNDLADLEKCSFMYARNGEPDIDKFLNYEFKGFISFNSKTGLKDISISDDAWKSSDNTSQVLKFPYNFDMQINKEVTLAGNRTKLRELGIYTVKMLVEDEFLGKTRKQSFVFKTTYGDGFGEHVYKVDKTNSNSFKYMLVYQTMDGQKFNTEPQEGNWGDAIVIGMNIPSTAKVDDLQLKDVLPKLTALAINWLQESR